jgi:hypothetical protein
LAFYTVFSLAPMMLLLFAIFGLIYGNSEVARQEILHQVYSFLDRSSARAVQDIAASIGYRHRYAALLDDLQVSTRRAALLARCAVRCHGNRGRVFGRYIRAWPLPRERQCWLCLWSSRFTDNDVLGKMECVAGGIRGFGESAKAVSAGDGTAKPSSTAAGTKKKNPGKHSSPRRGSLPGHVGDFWRKETN